MFSLSEQELADISAYIREKYGVNLAAKSTLIEGRLGCYLQSKGFESYGAYFDFAKSDPAGEEMANLINRLTTNHTYFMRENDHFEIFAREVLPWIESLDDSKDLRLWCAGCSTGEEPYGLSIFIYEYLAAHGYRRADSAGPKAGAFPGDIDTTILASDISEKALSAASEGVYLYENLAAISPEWTSKYFIDLGNGAYRVTPALRANVAFKKINLLDPFTVRKPYHTVFCRNVMIYFDAETRLSLINRFCDAMLPGGYLFIGHSESLTSFRHGFEYIRPSVYRKPL
ncbi:MAG: protein-glutamate O-methyltransferase CheR [Clostridiales Family XIII bacterium]|jgi:chemotaxis protein methyltransferase CheR|nr:protein-glutamate O-methyltransferase CheR [Clostridiales Family XIII bacterium]